MSLFNDYAVRILEGLHAGRDALRRRSGVRPFTLVVVFGPAHHDQFHAAVLLDDHPHITWLAPAVDHAIDVAHLREFAARPAHDHPARVKFLRGLNNLQHVIVTACEHEWRAGPFED